MYRGFCFSWNSTVNESIRDLSGIPSWPIKFAIKLKPFVFIKRERLNYAGTLLMKSHDPLPVRATEQCTSEDLKIISTHQIIH